MMSIISSILFGLSYFVMIGGVIYYIVVGTKKELNPLKGAAFIFAFVLIGAIIAAIAILLQ